MAAFLLQRPSGGSLDHIQTLGSPLSALTLDSCTSCGPYLMLERCVARGVSNPVSDIGGCGRDWQGELGYTRRQSTFLGRDVVEGMRKSEQSTESLQSRLTPQFLWSEGKDMAGISAIRTRETCGTFLSDGPSFNSVFKIHRV